MARARNTDTTPSHEAAEAATVGSGILRLRVHKVMRQHGDWMTHDEVYVSYLRHASIHDWSPASESGVRSRVRELFEDGWVERDSGDTVKNARGRSVHQWRAVTDPATADRNRDRYLADLEWETTHMPQIKAEQDARERQREAADALVEAGDAQDAAEAQAWRYATETDHLEALPLDAAILLVGGHDRDVILQQTHVGRWAATGSPARLAARDIVLPALILHIPADAELDMTQFPTEP